MANETILVTGANGNLGTATIGFLLKKNPDARVRALVRSEGKGRDLRTKGIEIVVGDYTDYDSVVHATEAVQTVMLISSNTPGNRYSQHANVIRAARQNGVEHIVYTSVLKASPNSKFIAGKLSLARNTFSLIGNLISAGARAKLPTAV